MYLNSRDLIYITCKNWIVQKYKKKIKYKLYLRIKTLKCLQLEKYLQPCYFVQGTRLSLKVEHHERKPAAFQWSQNAVNTLESHTVSGLLQKEYNYNSRCFKYFLQPCLTDQILPGRAIFLSVRERRWEKIFQKVCVFYSLQNIIWEFTCPWLFFSSCTAQCSTFVLFRKYMFAKIQWKSNIKVWICAFPSYRVFI